MFKNLKLSAKISLGFITILGITFILVGTGIFNMNKSSKLSHMLDKEYIPEVKIATDLSNAARGLMYEMRGYGFTRETDFFEYAMKELKSLEKHLVSAKELEVKASNLTKLKEEIQNAEKSKEEYAVLINQTVEIDKNLTEERDELNKAAALLIKSSTEFLESQKEKLDIAIKNRRIDEIKERTEKIILMNEILYLGSGARIIYFKAQADRTPLTMNEAMPNFEKMTNIMPELRKITTKQVDIDSLNNVEKSFQVYRDNMKHYLAAWLKKEELAAKRDAAGKKVLQSSFAMADSGILNTEKISKDSFDSLRFTSNLMAVGTAILIVLGFIMTYFIVRSISKPITRIVEELGNGADQVFNASEQLSLASQELAEGSSEQASSIEETSSTLDETSSMVAQNTENTKQASLLSSNAKDSAEKGNKEMNEMVEAMDEIKSSSDEISKIIKVIDDIAFQTNILALNAAVEAARAGEAGMGFAVVAEEVRNLAQRSAQAAKDTSSMIEKSMLRADRGVDIARKVAEALGEIRVQSEKVNEIMDEITTASQEQSQGVVQITKAVSQMEQVTQSIASNAEESASSSEELSAQAENMKQIVEQLSIMIYGISYSQNKASFLKQKKSKKHIDSKKMTSSNSNSNSSSKRLIVKPEEVIPLEDDALDF